MRGKMIKVNKQMKSESEQLFGEEQIVMACQSIVLPGKYEMKSESE